MRGSVLSKAACAAVCAFATARALAALPDMMVTFDPSMRTYKDLSQSRSFTDCGYAGCIADEGPEYCDEFFVRHPDETWESFKKAGAYVVKLWSADEKWAEDKARAKIAYDWRKRHNVKTLLCIEHHGRSIGEARRRILSFVQWIVDNGYTDQVAGFELGNEPYWGSQPEKYAERWAEIVPAMKEIWPEAQIGVPLAEYMSGDPDIAEVRKRMTHVDALFRMEGDARGVGQINQWSGRFVTAFSNCLHLCSHVVYHFYGGFGPYGCSYNGIQRIRNFAKAFPEVKDKKVWITEWRFTSDNDLIGQQKFRVALFDAFYMLMCVCQPEVEGLSAHQCGQLSGGFYIADGHGGWVGQRRGGSGGMFVDPDWTGHPRLEVGPTGPAFRLINETALGHPHVLARGRRTVGSIDDGNYNQVAMILGNSAQGGCMALEWVLYANPERTKFALVVANAGLAEWRPTVKTVGCRLGKPHYQFYRSTPEHECMAQYAGEPRLSWEESSDGQTEGELVIPGLTIASVFYDVKKGGR